MWPLLLKCWSCSFTIYDWMEIYVVLRVTCIDSQTQRVDVSYSDNYLEFMTFSNETRMLITNRNHVRLTDKLSVRRTWFRFIISMSFVAKSPKFETVYLLDKKQLCHGTSFFVFLHYFQVIQHVQFRHVYQKNLKLFIICWKI